MSFISRLFNRKGEATRFVQPDDISLRREMAKAKVANNVAARRLKTVAEKHARDAEFAKQVIQDMLDRANLGNEVGKNGAGS